tara:strand:- start:426 stop:1100 length:675 start_codon:yes stop_codon:yes gene_type:complete
MCHVNNFSDYSKTIATYGFLRGTGQVLKKSKNFFYIDHGYFKQSSRNFKKNKTQVIDLDGYFRIVHNDFWHNSLGEKSNKRFEKLNINIKNLKKNGDYIILSEPSIYDINFFKLENWIENTKNKLKNISDRKIIIHNRSSKTPLVELLKNAWAFVSNHSTAGFTSMIEGVPAYFTNPTLSNVSEIKDIEKHEINYKALYNLAYEQWNIKEIETGEAWDYLSKQQ